MVQEEESCGDRPPLRGHPRAAGHSRTTVHLVLGLVQVAGEWRDAIGAGILVHRAVPASLQRKSRAVQRQGSSC